MKLLIISDLHYPTRGNIDIKKFLKEKPFDLLIYCGDFVIYEAYLEIKAICGEKILAVYGNMDDWSIKKELPEQIITKISGKRILIFHSFDIYPRGDNHQLLQKVIDNHCNIVFYGHTHYQKITEYSNGKFQELNNIDKIDPDKIYFINPGSLLDGNYLELNI